MADRCLRLGYPCPCGFSAGEAECFREYEEWRQTYAWALASEGIFPSPVLPPSIGRFERDLRCCLDVRFVDGEKVVDGAKDRRFAGLRRWLARVSFLRAGEAGEAPKRRRDDMEACGVDRARELLAVLVPGCPVCVPVGDHLSPVPAGSQVADGTPSAVELHVQQKRAASGVSSSVGTGEVRLNAAAGNRAHDKADKASLDLHARILCLNTRAAA